ncbi:hypothetical protein HPB47_014180, partial [Ixodes persulcatus]
MSSRADPQATEEKKLRILRRGVKGGIFGGLVRNPQSTVRGFVTEVTNAERALQTRSRHYQRLLDVTAISSSSCSTPDIREIIRDVVREEIKELLPTAASPASPSIAEIAAAKGSRQRRSGTTDAELRRNGQTTAASSSTLPGNATTGLTNAGVPPTPRRTTSVRPPRTTYDKENRRMRTADRRPVCYHCGEADHIYRRCPYRQLGQRGFHPNHPRPRLTFMDDGGTCDRHSTKAKHKASHWPHTTTPRKRRARYATDTAPCGRVSKRLVAPSGGQDTNYWYVPVVLLSHGAGFVFGFVMASAASRPKKRTSTYCCVYDCHNSYINTAGKLPAVKFYRFPGKPYEADRRRKWIAAVRRATWQKRSRTQSGSPSTPASSSTEDAGPSTTVADHSASEDDQATSVEPPLQEGDSMHAVNAFTQTERVDEVGPCNLFLSVTSDGDASTQVTHAIMTSVAIEAATECASTAVGPDRRSCIFAGYDSLVGKSGALEELCSNLVSATSSWIPNPSSSSLQATMPECFKAHYPKCRYIIDCTEVRTETPATLEQQRALFSNYKGCHTLKFLIAILPNGTVSFVSQAYGGRSSDTYITIDSGFLERIEPGDVVLADKGFPGIKAPVESKHGVMVFPPFSKGQLQFTSAEMEMTYQVAK